MRNLSKTVLGTVAAITLTATAAFAQTVPAQNNCSYVFNTNMKLGNVSSDVMNLQKLLNQDVRTQVSASGVGSKGSETSRFGPATFAAVKKFQAANGVSPVSGFAGPLTRVMLNKVCGGTSSTTTPVVQSGPISVQASASQPNSTLVEGQSAANLGTFVFTGNGSVSSVEFMRTGVSSNNTLANVYLYEGATRLTDSASVLTDGTIRFNAPWSVNGTRTITVRADIASPSSGQTVGVAAKSITLAGATSSTLISGVMSGLQAVANAQLAGVAFTGANSAASGGNINAGTLAYNVWGASFNVNTRAVNLKGMTFKMIGSAPMNSLSNVTLFVDGVAAGTSSFNGNGLAVFDMMSNPKMLQTGAHNVELRADIVGGANRSFTVSIENIADMQFEDSNLLGVFVSPAQAGYQTVKTAGTVNIQTGNLVINQNPAFTVTNVVGGASNVTLGSFRVTAFGEDTKLQTLPVKITAPAALSDVALFVNGGQVGTSQNMTSAAQTLTYNLGSQFTVMSGTPVVFEVRANLIQPTTGTLVTSGTVQVEVNPLPTPLLNGAQGIQSSNLTNIPNSLGQNLTIGGSIPTFSKVGSFSNRTESPNTQNTKIGSFVFQNSNVEDVSLNNIAVGLGVTGMALTNVTSLTLKDGANTVGNVFGTVSAANNFSLSGVTIPRNGSKTFDVFANLGGVAGTVQADAQTTFRGVTSSVVTTPPVAPGAVITSANTLLTVSNVSKEASSPVSQLAVGNTTSKIVDYKVVSTVAPVTIEELTFSVSNIAKVVAVKVGSVTRQINALTANVLTGLSIAVPAGNSGVTIPVEVTYGNINTIGGSTSDTGTTTTVTLTDVKYRSGTNVQTLMGLATSSNAMQVVASKPTVTVPSTIAGGLNLTAENKIGEATVAADAAGNVTLKTLTFAVSNSGFTTAPTAFTGVSLKVGNSIINDATCTPTGVTSIACVFATGYTVTAGQNATFGLFATMTGAANTGTNQAQVSTRLTNNLTTFEWIDVVGSSATLNGQAILNFPTTSYTARQ
jgi:Putative peptidoglycan binding domain